MMKIFYSHKDDLKKDKIKIPYVQFLIILIGLGSSFWTYLLHIQLKSLVGSPLICDINETINCSKIIGSSQGELFGIPLGIWGMTYWLIGLWLIFLPKFSNVSLKYISFWRMIVSAIGFVSALVLIYISYFILKGICEFCSIIQASCIIYFIASFISYKKVKKDNPYYASKIDFIKFASSIIISVITPLLIFTSTKSYFHNYYKNKAPKVIAITDSKYQIQTPLLPLLDNKDVDYSIGKNGAPVEIIQFTDFECPYCQLLHEKLNELRPLVKKGKVKIYFRNWPLSYHKYATKLAIAARCAGLQGKFWSFADWSFKTARKYLKNSKKKEESFSNKGIVKQAKSFSLNISNFKKCLINKDIIKKLNKDRKDANQLGGSGTPFLLVNGYHYKGNWLKPNELKKYILNIINNR